MKMYKIDGTNLSMDERLFIDRQLQERGYVYSPLRFLDSFTFYAEDWERVYESLDLPKGCEISCFG